MTPNGGKVYEKAIGKSDSTCWPQDAAGLAHAVEVSAYGIRLSLRLAMISHSTFVHSILLNIMDQASACGLIVLTNANAGAYALEKEIVVSRPVVIMGHPVVYPKIDAHAKKAVRAFRVTVRE